MDALQQRLTKLRIRGMRDPRFAAMAGVMMVGTWAIKDGKGTAATNGRDRVYFRDFFTSLSDEEALFVILHEEFHIMLMHLIVWRKLKVENQELAGQAMDYVINGMLDNLAGPNAKDPLIRMPAMGCLDHKFDGMDTLQVYKLLQGQGGNGGKGGKSLDSHEFDDCPEDSDSGLENLNEEEMQATASAVDVAVRQGQQMAGRTGANTDLFPKDLLEAVIPWEEVLRDFVTANCAGRDSSTWRKPNRRWLGRGVYMPSTISESVGRIVIGIDTSGSIGQEMLTRFMSEVSAAVAAVTPDFVDVIYWDAHVAGHEQYEGDDVTKIAEVTKPRGGGGTAPSCMSDYMTKNNITADCIIMFSDGYVGSDWGNWNAPVLWCLTTKGITAANGKTLFVPVN